ncbi:MAG: TRAP transporter large permease subunit [Syntrophales bacterium]
MTQTLESSLIFLAMGAAFIAAYRYCRLLTILSMLAAALTGALVSGTGVLSSLHHVIEGSFTFLNIVLIIITGTLFVEVQKESGALDALVKALIIRFHRYQKTLLVILMFLIIIPGALTGPGASGVIALGGLVSPILLGMGIPLVQVVAFITLGGVLGDIAPPINIPAMIISAGINMPYAGFFAPLAVITILLAIFSALFIGIGHLKGPVSLDELLKSLPETPAKMKGVRIFTPLIVVVGLMIVVRLFPYYLPPLGVPLMFLIGTVVALLLGGKVDMLRISSDVVRKTLPVTGILIAVGPLVQVMSLTGVKGLFVLTAITVPSAILYMGLFVGLPLSGSILGTFGAASILGIPFMLALLGRDPIIATIGLSLISALATLTPPTAITGKAAGLVAGYTGDYLTVLKKCLIPWLIIDVVGLALVMYADALRWLRF